MSFSEVKPQSVLCHTIVAQTANNHLKPEPYFIYHQLKQSETLCSAHNAFICFAWISEQTAIISLYSINWLVCITETECVYCAVRTGSLYIIQVMCFVWISEQTAIISLYSINSSVFITEANSVYCAVRTGSLNQTDTVSSWKGTTCANITSLSEDVLQSSFNFHYKRP